MLSIIILLAIILYLLRPRPNPKPSTSRTLSLTTLPPITLKPQQPNHIIPIPSPPPSTRKKKRKPKKPRLSESTQTMVEVPEEQLEESEQEEKLTFQGKVSQEEQKMQLQLQDYFRYEFVLEELEMIRNYFPREVSEMIPHSQRIMGTYEIGLFDVFEDEQERKEVKVRWVYTMDYPKQPATIKILDVTLPKHLQLQVSSMVSESASTSCQQVFVIYELLVKLYQLILDFNNLPLLQQSLHQQQQLQQQPPNIQLHPSSLQIQNHTLHQPLLQSALNHSKRKDQYDQFMDVMINPYLPGDVRDRPDFDTSVSRVQDEHEPEYQGRSRYKSQFEEIQKLGEGGFGSVFLSRNHLDKNLNAIKKIRLNMADTNYRKVKVQVTLLSKLNHPNIVRYYQSWIEKVDSIEQLCEQLGIEDSEQLEEIKAEYERYGRSEHGDILFGEESEGEGESEEEEEQDLGISAIEEDPFFVRERSNKSLLEEGYSEEQSKSQIESRRNQKSHTQKQFPFQILYIAMEYCSGLTLKQFIKNELQLPVMKDEDKVDERKTKIVRGILQALVYLHDKKIIHRDLKPANIFFDKQKQRVKLGDFGLATTLEDSQLEKGIVGTPLYRAPEGFDGDSKYAQKTDIYALGIILFELYYNKNYKTDTQRFHVMIALSKQQRLPSDFEQYCKNPEVRHQIKQMISKDPSKRPSAREILSRVNNRLFGQLVSAITNPTHFQFHSLLTSLFQIKSPPTSNPFLREPFRRYNYSNLQQIFLCHRGTNIHVSPLIPVQDYQSLNRKKWSIMRQHKLLTLSKEGAVLEMSNSSYLPWLRCLKEYLGKNLRNRPKTIRRYSFCEVVEEKKEGGGFREAMLGVFDVVDVSREDLMEDTAEMIKMSLQVGALGKQGCTLHISHSLLVRIIAEEFAIGEETLYRVLLSREFQRNIEMDDEAWQNGFKNYDIQATISRRIYKLFKLCADDPSTFIQQLHKQLPNRKLLLQHVHDQLLDLKKLLCYMKIQPPTYDLKYRLLSPPQSTSGIFWRLTTQSHPILPILSGFTTTQQYYRLQDMNLVHIELQLTPLPKPLIEVFVWTLGDDMLEKEMVEIVSELWDNNISADWSKVSLGEKVEGVKVGLILKRTQKKVWVGMRRFEGLGAKVEWYPREGYTVEMVSKLLEDK